MNLANLSLLVDIIEAGNLSKAAVRLGVSRANVSQRLNQFERELGQQLGAWSLAQRCVDQRHQDMAVGRAGGVGG